MPVRLNLTRFLSAAAGLCGAFLVVAGIPLFIETSMAASVRVVHGWATNAVAVVSAEEEDACDALERIRKALAQPQQPQQQQQQQQHQQQQHPASLSAQLQAAVASVVAGEQQVVTLAAAQAAAFAQAVATAHVKVAQAFSSAGASAAGALQGPSPDALVATFFVLPAAGQSTFFFSASGSELGYVAVTAAGETKIFFDDAGQRVAQGVDSAGRAVVTVAAPAVSQLRELFDAAGAHVGQVVMPAAGQVRTYFDSAGHTLGHAFAPAGEALRGMDAVLVDGANHLLQMTTAAAAAAAGGGVGAEVLALPIAVGALCLLAALAAAARVRTLLARHRLQGKLRDHLAQRLAWLGEVLDAAAKCKGFATTQGSAVAEAALFLRGAAARLEEGDAAAGAASARCCCGLGCCTCCSGEARAWEELVAALEPGLDRQTRRLHQAMIVYARTHAGSEDVAAIRALLPQPLGALGDDSGVAVAQSFKVRVRLQILSFSREELEQQCERRGLGAARGLSLQALRSRLAFDVLGADAMSGAAPPSAWDRCWAAATCRRLAPPEPTREAAEAAAKAVAAASSAAAAGGALALAHALVDEHEPRLQLREVSPKK